MATTNTKVVAKNELDKFAMEEKGVRVNTDSEARLFRLCDLADLLDDEFGSENIQVSVKPSELHGVVCVDTDEVLFDGGRSHLFFEYLKSSDFLHFSKTKSGMLRICFGVKDLWVRQ
jgi:hypothetical protein|nr:MAG TPA: hypothetical protein [Caudoviricetes sp.]